MVARRVRVTGRVQGVFFRAWTREQAEDLGVKGWVRNCSDGSVEAHLEGDADAVVGLIDLLRKGPPGARVDDLRSDEAQPEHQSSFEVRH
jgi:acylphosphatase